MPHCIVCHSPARPTTEKHGLYQLCCCSNCGLQFSYPMSASAENYCDAYDDNSGPPEVHGEGLPFLGWTEEASCELSEFASFLTAAQHHALQLVRQRFPDPQHAPALEIGFGAGWFLGGLRAAGFTPYGVEVAHSPVSTLSKKGFPVHCSPTGELAPDWPAPVLITAFEVLEHLADPVGFLTGLCERHGGADLMLSVPDERRWFLLGGREAHDYPPNHLTRWSEEALLIALDRAGFRRIEVFHLLASAQELSMASVRRFLPGKKIGKTPATRPGSSLSQELRKRKFRRKLFLPVAAVLPLFRRTACSMLAVASNPR